MNTDYWGPAAWKVLHTIPWFYSEELTPQEQEEVVGFHHALGNVLPCVFCRDSVRKFMQAYPPSDYVSKRVQLAQYESLLHNLVNVKLGKTVHKNLGTAISAAATTAQEFHNALMDLLWFLARNYTAGEGSPPSSMRKRQYRLFFRRLLQVLAGDEAFVDAVHEQMPLNEALRSRKTLEQWTRQMRISLGVE